MKWEENFYIGGDEYFIGYENGTHHICEVYPTSCDDAYKVVFSGMYHKCLEYKDELLMSLY